MMLDTVLPLAVERQNVSPPQLLPSPREYAPLQPARRRLVRKRSFSRKKFLGNLFLCGFSLDFAHWTRIALCRRERRRSLQTPKEESFPLDSQPKEEEQRRGRNIENEKLNGRRGEEAAAEEKKEREGSTTKRREATDKDKACSQSETTQNCKRTLFFYTF